MESQLRQRLLRPLVKCAQENKMKVGNLQMEEGAKITNLTAPSGTSFPDNGNLAELFVLLPAKVLYMHDGTSWTQVATQSLPTLATVATSGSFDDLLDKPNTADIPEGTNLYFTAQRAADAAPVQSVAGLSGAPSAAQVKTALAITTDDVSGTLSASRLVGTINIENIPAAAIERMIVVADQAARFALTTATAQKGDTVKQTSDNTMWYIVDDANLGNASGYSEYTAGQASSVPWAGITGKPTALQGAGTSIQYIGADLVVRNLAGMPISTATQTALDAKAPTANPTFSGIAKYTGAIQETRNSLAANNIDLAVATVFSKTISAITTLSVSNIPATGTVVSFILDLTNGGAFAITWWAGIKWAGGAAPVLTASGRDVLGFFCYDGGTTWTGLLLAKDVK